MVPRDVISEEAVMFVNKSIVHLELMKNIFKSLLFLKYPLHVILSSFYVINVFPIYF